MATELHAVLIGFIHNGNIKAQMSSLVKNSLAPRRREHLSVANTKSGDCKCSEAGLEKRAVIKA